MVVRYDVRGQKELRDNMERIAENLHGLPMVTAMRRATLVIERDAKRFAPVDTGRLRSSINSTVRTAGLFPGSSLQGITGTNVTYAPYMENGTGLFAGRPRHRMPPISALEGWARRHRMNAYVVALAIARRGGLEPREFFKKSVNKNRGRVVEILGEGVRVAIRS